MEEQNKSLEELFIEMSKNLDKESLKHWDNIMSSVVELTKIKEANPNNSSIHLWALFIMYMLGGNLSFTDFENKKKDETN